MSNLPPETTPGTLRAQIVTALEKVGLEAYDYMVEHVTPPCFIVVPAEPYLARPDDGEVPFGVWDCRHNVIVIAGRGTNDVQAAELDMWVVYASSALQSADYEPTEITQPGEIKLNGQSYLAAVITIHDHIRLPEIPFPTQGDS